MVAGATTCSICDGGYFVSGTSCDECYESYDCLYCTSTSLGACTLCQPGQYLVNGTCTFDDDDYRPNLCPNGCAACGMPNYGNCTQCTNLTFSSNGLCVESCYPLISWGGNCVTSCPTGYQNFTYNTPPMLTCQQIITLKTNCTVANCTLCPVNITVCTACVSGYFLNIYGLCALNQTCLPGYYLSQNGTC